MPPYLAFALMCLAWGSTFVAAKVAVAYIPPIFLFGMRFLVAGGIIALWLWLHKTPARVTPQDQLKLWGIAVLNIVIGYGLGFWSLPYLSSGLAGVINFSSVALSVLAFSLLLRQEKATPFKLLGIGLGVLGLVLLFAPSLHVENKQQGVAILAMVLGAWSAGLAAVLVRPLAKRYSAFEINRSQMLPGSVALILLSLSLEPISLQTLKAFFRPDIGLAFAYLVGVGSIMALSFYYMLLARWPTTRVSSYTFICPIIALLLGVIFLHEQITALELLATGVLLSGATLTLRSDAH